MHILVWKSIANMPLLLNILCKKYTLKSSILIGSFKQGQQKSQQAGGF